MRGMESQYRECFQQYLDANDIVNVDKQRAAASVGGSIYTLLHSLVALRKSSGCSLEIVEILHNHYQPSPSVIIKCFRLNSCTCCKEDSVAVLMAELRCLMESCEFGTILNEILRDWLICGINEPRLQHRFLAEITLTFTKALEIAQAYESAKRNVLNLQTSTPQTTQVHTGHSDHEDSKDSS